MSNFIFITASDIIEYLYCPRFIYYQNVLDIEQHEHQRYLVNKGRDIHLVGRMDEVLTLADNTMASLDYKFADYEEKLFKTLKTQQIIYSLLIEENYNCRVNKAFIVYVRSKNLLKQIDIYQKDKEKSLKIIDDVFDIINKNHFPLATKNKLKCQDCTYKNLCFS